jgi:hypothetical protein
MINTPEEYLDTLDGDAKEWLSEFYKYMEKKHKQYSVIMFRQRPMYKKETNYLKGYLMFTANPKHFSVHTLYFDIIEEMKTILPEAEFGKGCVKIKYKYINSKETLKKMCDKVIGKFCD